MDVDPGYLHRMAAGVNTNPSAAMLRRMGIQKVITYKLAR